MPLYIYERPTGVWHIRGTHHGVAVDRSAKTRVRADAEAVKDKIARDILYEVVHERPRERSFAEAAAGYMRGGGERGPLKAILLEVGDKLIKDMTQEEIDRVALKIYPHGAPSTRNRKVYTPIAAVLNWAADSWATPRKRIRRPSQPSGRVDWRTPAEIERWIGVAGHVAPILTFFVGTGVRASEGVGLDWQDVSPAAERITLWGDQTKGGYDRHVDLQSRVRSIMPARGDGAVWRNKAGGAWHAYDAVNLWLRRKAEADETLPHLHLHVLRHTWATWAYAVTKDLHFVMNQGGWKSPELAMRYIHAGTDDLATAVLAHGWEFDGKRKATTRKKLIKAVR